MASLKFTKMHGIGNDYIYIDGFRHALPADPASFSRRVSDRHRGVGGDGVILILPPTRSEHDARMRMFNADGSESQMCGNGLRCVAKYVYDHGLARKPSLTIETGRGPLTVAVHAQGDFAESVTVNMGVPILESALIPTTLPGDPPLDAPVDIAGKKFTLSCVSMGNPHAIAFVDEISDDWVLRVGPAVERSPLFPQRVNAEFVRVRSPGEADMRVWERGSGETMACGTGACAVAVAGVLTGRLQRHATIHLPGGDLVIEWRESDGCVHMTGAATEVFHGEIDD